jgi:hypothetical protein
MRIAMKVHSRNYQLNLFRFRITNPDTAAFQAVVGNVPIT